MSDPQLQPEGEPQPQKRPRLAFAPISSIAPLPEGERWLVEGFLANGSLTVIGASPKVGKTFLCLGLAAAVASGRPALGRFSVAEKARVMLFAAEDDPRLVRGRMQDICAGQNLVLDEGLEVDVITSESLKLDDAKDRERLEEALQERKPRLLILDPLVRLHSGTESSAQHMSELFGYLRQLIRRHRLSIIVTHHLAKNRSGAAASQPGHALRGSGDLHAAYDHGVALTRQSDGSVLMTLEHRSAAAPDPICYRLVSQPGGGVRFEFFAPELDEGSVRRGGAARTSPRNPATRPAAPLGERVLAVLAAASCPLSQVSIREQLGVRNAALTVVLRQLAAEGKARSLGRMGGWTIQASATGNNLSDG